MDVNDGSLVFECVGCKKIMRRILTKIQPRDSRIHTDYVTDTLINFFRCCEKVFINMSTWIIGRDSMKRHCQTRKNSTAIWQQKTSQILITNTQIESRKILKIKYDYHGLYVQSDTLLLADVFESFRNKCIGIYELDPALFLSAPRSTWQAYLKKAEQDQNQ